MASWVLFLWLFALMAHDGLSNVQPVMWGTPLVLALFYLCQFTGRACYKDFLKLHPNKDGKTPAWLVWSSGWARKVGACFTGSNREHAEDVSDSKDADGLNTDAPTDAGDGDGDPPTPSPTPPPPPELVPAPAQATPSEEFFEDPWKMLCSSNDEEPLAGATAAESAV